MLIEYLRQQKSKIEEQEEEPLLKVCTTGR